MIVEGAGVEVTPVGRYIRAPVNAQRRLRSAARFHPVHLVWLDEIVAVRVSPTVVVSLERIAGG